MCIRDSWRTHHPECQVTFKNHETTPEVVCRAPQLVLARSLVDLLDNAAESSASQSAEIEITVGTQGAHAMICVSDRGQGVSKLVKERLGDPFLSTKPDGIGLGLYAVKSLMEALGGALRVNDRLHGGTSVVMTIPLLQQTGL